MVTYIDEVYKRVKLIKQGRAQIAPELQAFAYWVSTTFGVDVLSVEYDHKKPKGLFRKEKPRLFPVRLEIILEYKRDFQTIYGVPYPDLRTNQVKPNQVKEAFVRYTHEHGLHPFDEDPKSFVIFSVFEPIAIEEAMSGVTDSQRDELIKRLGNDDIWLIHSNAIVGRLVFMFYTDQQRMHYESIGYKALYRSEYFKLVKPYDEFGYMDEADCHLEFDSKENFDNSYGGSWFGYDR